MGLANKTKKRIGTGAVLRPLIAAKPRQCQCVYFLCAALWGGKCLNIQRTQCAAARQEVFYYHICGQLHSGIASNSACRSLAFNALAA